MRGVCKSWQAGFEASATSIRVSRSGPLLPPAASLQMRFPALTSLGLGNSRMNEEDLVHLRGLDKLRSLNLALLPEPPREPGGQYCPPSYERLAWKLTDSGLENLRGLQLTSLYLGSSHISGAGLGHLLGMPLASLCLAGCHCLTNTGLKFLRALPLTRLVVITSNLPPVGPGADVAWLRGVVEVVTT